MKLVLASASPRRADLLRAAGFSFDTLVVDVDETPGVGEAPVSYVERLAAQKAAAAQEVLRSRNSHGSKQPERSGTSPVILAADTAVVVDGHILGKPGSAG